MHLLSLTLLLLSFLLPLTFAGSPIPHAVQAIIPITTIKELDNLISSTTITVLEFTRSKNCGPCANIAPTYQRLNTENSFQGAMMFAKADVVYAEKELKTKYNVKAEPTWVVIKKGTGAVETYEGADPNKLEEAVLRHAGPGGTQGGFG